MVIIDEVLVVSICSFSLIIPSVNLSTTSLPRTKDFKTLSSPHETASKLGTNGLRQSFTSFLEDAELLFSR